MLRNSSTQALPKRTIMGRSCKVRSVPIKEPNTSASTKASTETDTVQPQADSIQSREVISPPLPKQLCTTSLSMVSWQNTCKSQLIGAPLKFLVLRWAQPFASPTKKPLQTGWPKGHKRSENYFFAQSSMGLSLGDAHAALVASDIGRPILVLVAGTGCMNHLSYSLASEPSAIWRLMESSTAFLKAGSSLRSMQAIGSTLRTSPTIL